MSESKYLTVDNYGVDQSKQYALNQQELEQNPLNDWLLVSKKTETSVITTAPPSADALKFSIGRATIWAALAPPPGALFTAGRLFRQGQLIPSLGTRDHQENKRDHLSRISPTNPVEQEKLKKILDGCDAMISKEKDSEQIDSRRGQFNKG